MEKAANSRRGAASFSDEDLDAIAGQFKIENSYGLRQLLDGASWYRLPLMSPKALNAPLVQESASADAGLEFAGSRTYGGRLNERWLLSDLAEGFEKLTGESVTAWTGSRFVKFAGTILRHLGLPVQSDEALRKRIGRLLNEVAKLG